MKLAEGGYIEEPFDVITFDNSYIISWRVYDKERFTRLLDILNKDVVE